MVPHPLAMTTSKHHIFGSKDLYWPWSSVATVVGGNFAISQNSPFVAATKSPPVVYPMTPHFTRIPPKKRVAESGPRSRVLLSMSQIDLKNLPKTVIKTGALYSPFVFVHPVLQSLWARLEQSKKCRDTGKKIKGVFQAPLYRCY